MKNNICLILFFMISVCFAKSQNIMKLWPAPISRILEPASCFSSGSFPSSLTLQAPLDSTNARPNFIPGTLFTKTSYRSSTVLMKCDWPRIKLIGSGFSISTIRISIFFSLVRFWYLLHWYNIRWLSVWD